MHPHSRTLGESKNCDWKYQKTLAAIALALVAVLYHDTVRCLTGQDAEAHSPLRPSCENLRALPSVSALVLGPTGTAGIAAAISLAVCAGADRSLQLP